MQTRFDERIDEVTLRARTLGPRARAFLLLSYATRYTPLFELFEAEAPKRMRTFRALVSSTWDATRSDDREAFADNLASLMEMVPGEDWVVDGFHDGVAQSVGNLLLGALEWLLGKESDDYEGAILDVLRPLLSEIRLSRSEPGSDTVGAAFDASLHLEPIVAGEFAFATTLISSLGGGALDAAHIRRFALEHEFDLSPFVSNLRRGLVKDSGA